MSMEMLSLKVKLI